MPGIFAVMLGTATAQAILPALVFWPLFFVFQVILWTSVIIGIFRKIFWFGANRYVAHRNYTPPENKRWSEYKNTFLG